MGVNIDIGTVVPQDPSNKTHHRELNYGDRFYCRDNGDALYVLLGDGAVQVTDKDGFEMDPVDVYSAEELIADSSFDDCIVRNDLSVSLTFE